VMVFIVFLATDEGRDTSSGQGQEPNFGTK